MSTPKSSGLDIEAKLLISAEEATAGARRDVDVVRIVRCTTCLSAKKDGRAAGCGACTDGLTSREQRLSVKVPAGIAAGTRLRLSGKGHESAQRPTGNLYLEVRIAGPRGENADAPKLGQAKPAPEKPAPAKPHAPEAGGLFSDAELRKQRRAKTMLLSAAAAVAIAGITAFGYDHYSRADLGASCARNGDCRSKQCLGLYAAAPLVPISPSLSPEMEMIPLGSPRRTGGMCSDSCRGDQDCPPRMRCAPASRSAQLDGLPDLGPGEPNTLVCVSR